MAAPSNQRRRAAALLRSASSLRDARRRPAQRPGVCVWGLTSSNGDAAHPRCQGDVGRCRSAPGEAGQTLPVPAPLGGAAAPPLPVRRAEPAGREPQGSLSCRGREGGGLRGGGRWARFPSERKVTSGENSGPRLGRAGTGGSSRAPGLPRSARIYYLPSWLRVVFEVLSHLGNGFTPGKRRHLSLRPFHSGVFDALPHYVYNRPTRVYGI